MARPLMFLMTAAVVAGLAACGGVPSRPASVPADAAWGGEGKKGVFLQVGEHQGTLWQLGVWDRQGRVLGTGKFRLRGFAKARIIPEEVLAWDNGALQLKDGTWLVPEPAAAP